MPLICALLGASGFWLRRVLRRRFPRLSLREVNLLAALIPAVAAWLLALGIDVTMVLYHRWYAPDEPFMAGFAVVGLPWAFASFACTFAVLAVAEPAG